MKILTVYYYRKHFPKNPARPYEEHIRAVVDLGERRQVSYFSSVPIYKIVSLIRGVSDNTEVFDDHNWKDWTRIWRGTGFIELSATDTVSMVIEPEIEKLVVWHKLIA